MANSKISALTSATTPLAGTETLPVVQSSTTKQVTVANLTAGRAVSFLNCTWGTAGYGDGNYLGVANTTPSAYGNRLVVGNYSDTSATLNGLQAATNKGILTAWADGATNGNGATISVGWANGGQGPLNLAIGATTTLQLAASGDVGFKTGNLVQGTAAKGINFTANTPAAGKTSQLLNWYEEGTWTPTLTPATSGTITLGSPNLCAYTRMGRVVTVNGLVDTASVSLPIGATVTIGGLPFTSNATGTQRSAGVARCFSLTTGSLNTTMVITSSVTTMILYVDASLFQTGSQVYFQISYTV